MRKNLVLMTILLFVIGCSSQEKAKVGHYSITQKDIDHRNEIIHIYYPNAQDPKYGLDQLVKAYTTAEVLIRNGHNITDETLENEAERIDKQTQSPGTLARIKSIFNKTDRKSYLKTFILPTYAERIIYFDFFLKNDALQAEAKQKAEEFLNAQSFASETKKRGLKPYTFHVSLRDGIEWPKPHDPSNPHANQMNSNQNTPPPRVQAKLSKDQQVQVSEDGKLWIEKILQGLKPGDQIPRLIDMNEHWMAARFVKKVGDRYQIEAVSFPKADFHKWFEAEKSKIPVTLPK